MAAEHYRSAQLVFGWSFYRQGTSGESSSADEFLDAALAWFGDPDPRLGTAWEKGERWRSLSRIVEPYLFWTAWSRSKIRLVHKKDGYVSLPSRRFCASLLLSIRDFASLRHGLPVADIADHERTSALRRDLEQLSSDAGAKLLRALGVKGDEAELQTASGDFSGHCLALTLLGSYLSDTYNGDIRCRKEVSERLSHDIRHVLSSKPCVPHQSKNCQHARA